MTLPAHLIVLSSFPTILTCPVLSVLVLDYSLCGRVMPPNNPATGDMHIQLLRPKPICDLLPRLPFIRLFQSFLGLDMAAAVHVLLTFHFHQPNCSSQTFFFLGRLTIFLLFQRVLIEISVVPAPHYTVLFLRHHVLQGFFLPFFI